MCSQLRFIKQIIKDLDVEVSMWNVSSTKGVLKYIYLRKILHVTTLK